LIGAGSSIVTTVCRVTSKRELGLLAGIRAPWTSDIIACDGRRWQEVDGTVYGGDRADIAVLIPDETVLVEGHREICTSGENDLWSVQRPCLQMYVDGGTASLDEIVMEGYLWRVKMPNSSEAPTSGPRANAPVAAATTNNAEAKPFIVCMFKRML